MAKPTLRDEMSSVLQNRGYDNGVDDDIFAELLDELEEIAFRHKGDF